MCVDRASRPLTYGQIVVRVSLATLPLAAISLANEFFITFGTSFPSTIFWVCASGWLVLLFVAGVLATRSTGSVPAGTAAGLIVGVRSGVVYLGAAGAILGLLYSSQAFVFCFGGCPPPPPPSLATVWDGILKSLGFVSIPIVVGGGCGLLGGVLGYWLYRWSPSVRAARRSSAS
jgi:hypothetical protein